MDRLDRGKIIIIGKSKAISTSKIKKITAIKKNRRENGSRDELLGSNPHSKGDLFSRSIIDFFERIEANIITIEDNKMIIQAIIIKVKIIYPELFQTL
jgi:hypothetical protein